MPRSVVSSASAGDPDEQLTTGEAGKLLSSSRQHVVNLCERGLLPFTTIGTHRRVRRADVDALRHRTDRLSRDEQRSLWLAYATGRGIVMDPTAARRVAYANIQRMRRVAQGSSAQRLDEWERLLDGPLDLLLSTYTGRDVRARELRQHNPFAGVLTDEERVTVLNAWRSEHSQ